MHNEENPRDWGAGSNRELQQNNYRQLDMMGRCNQRRAGKMRKN